MSISKRNILSDPSFELIETEVKGIEVYLNEKSHTIAVFYGRRSESTIYRIYTKLISALLAADYYIKTQFDANIRKEETAAKKKADAKIKREQVKIGDIFHTSWGYDQTNVEFFEVVGKPSKARVTIRQISSKVVENTSWCSNQEQPIPGAYIGNAKNCLVNSYGHVVKADEYGHNAYPTTAEATHYTSWGA